MAIELKIRKGTAIGLTIVVVALISFIEVYGLREYGFALFVLTPLLIGAGPAIIYGYKNEMRRKEALQMGMLTLLLFNLVLLAIAMEGLICIAMALPPSIVLTLIGSWLGYVIINRSKRNAPGALTLFILLIPCYSFFEKNTEPDLTAVVTSIDINAAPSTVWKNVVAFPRLKEPEEFIFKTGIAYPVNAEIEGTGVGALRHCNFTTGSFVEPITIWDEPVLLAFNVIQQPVPMKELSFWDVDAPHLHDFFVSKKGQFRLIQLPDNKTRLEGTTWYYDDIKPVFYWKLWSDYIIHKIHHRVLEHIKINSERSE